MGKISFADMPRNDIIAFHRQHGDELVEYGVSPLQILVAVLDHTPGFRRIPEVALAYEDPSNWKPIFGFLASLYDTTGRAKVKPSHKDLMEAAISFDKIPVPADTRRPNLKYLYKALRESAVRIAADRYENNHKEVKAPSLGEFGINIA